MATAKENLEERRLAITVELAALTPSAAGGLPDNQADQIAHVAYKDGLYRELKDIEALLTAEGGSYSEGPFSVVSESIP